MKLPAANLGGLATCVLIALVPIDTFGDTTAFDGISSFIGCADCLVGPSGGGSMGGTDVRLSWTDSILNPPVGYQGRFGSVDFSPPAGSSSPVVAAADEVRLEMTAKALPLNTSNFTENDPGTTGNEATVRPFLVEQNPGQFLDVNGNPDPNGNWVILREIYIYDFDASQFSDSDFTTLSTGVGDWGNVVLFVDVYTDDTLANPIVLNDFAGSFPNDGNFSNQPDFDTNGFIQVGFQTPFGDGATDGPNEGLVDLEVASVVLTVPEPATLVIAVMGVAFVGLGLRRR